MWKITSIGENKMTLNDQGIYCEQCKKYLNPYTEIFLSVLSEDSISCLYDHFLGIQTDPQWQEFTKEE